MKAQDLGSMLPWPNSNYDHRWEVNQWMVYLCLSLSNNPIGQTIWGNMVGMVNREWRHSSDRQGCFLLGSLWVLLETQDVT